MRGGRGGEERETYLGVFIASLLELLGHSRGLRLREQVNSVEHGNRDSKKLSDLGRHAQALTLRGLGTRAMRTESNPVGYIFTSTRQRHQFRQIPSFLNPH